MASISLHGVVLKDNKLFSYNSHLPLHSCNLFNSSNKINLSFKYAHKQRMLNCRVSSFDVAQPQVHETDDDKSVVETRQKVRKIDEGEAIEYIKELLRTTGDGRISVSPYDTAWVSLIEKIDGRDGPEFPSTLEWIAENQLSDGSWGDQHFFCAYDRLLNTLACVVALTFWNVHHQKVQKGVKYIRENVKTLEGAKAEHMTCGFEVVFPSLLQRAERMGIDGIPYEDPIMRRIQAAREEKLKRIPIEMMHRVTNSLLFSLEGLHENDLDWDRLLKLQSADGSFLTSPSSTAFAFMQTKDDKCFRFIANTLRSCNGGAPHTYPVDVFGRLWAVDRLQRLGISRFFESEISELLRHIYTCWSNKGVFSGRDSEFVDIDDTSMGFRLLRLHGYDVDPIVFMNFKNGDKFSCYGGQIIESSSPIYNLYRACQIAYPGEELLDKAKKFAFNFLQEQLQNDQLLDKWVISDHLDLEIKLGLQMPWYATLPRVLARFYIEHYAGGDDVWIGKTLYRMPEISNDTYKALAISDFKKCQNQHQMEWLYMQEWYESCGIEEFGVTRKELLRAYFLASSTIFEVEESKRRIAWAKSQIIIRMIRYSLGQEEIPNSTIHMVSEMIKTNNNDHINSFINGLNPSLIATLNQFFSSFDRYVNRQLRTTWGEWITKIKQQKEDDEKTETWEDAELIATTLNICSGHIVFNTEVLSHGDYRRLSKLSNKICRTLVQNRGVETVDEDMKELMKIVVEEKPDGVDREIRDTFLNVVKTFYYGAYFSPEVIDNHVFKVLFEPIV